MVRFHSFESMGTVDGPGLRLVIFLQGCNFRCLYCANPDTIDSSEGRLLDEDEIYRMATDMKPYFGRRGGVTFSGGEPTLQAKALIPLVERLKSVGIHICIDTNGSILGDDAKRLFSMVDLVLLDVKHIDEQKHQRLTGRSGEQTMRTAQWLEDNSKAMWLRYVLVSGYSSAKEDIETLGSRLSEMKMIERVELLPYHRLGVHKYEAMGLEYPLTDTKECTEAEITETEEILSRYFKNVIVQ